MGYIRIALRKRESILPHSLQSRKYFTCTIIVHFVRLLKFLPAAYFINDFLSRVDMAHKVRSKNLSCSNITVELSTCLTVKKAQFLSNPGNKQRFIDLLSEYLIRSGFSCLNAQSDADVLICRTAVTLLQTKCNVTVVGEFDDTDLLLILIDMTRNLSLNR